ncbi:MAG: Uma2 family endonuclease [Polyangiaceae bacterium]|nr:Uma2 family endonuclease [Polyangiaceae bacterium]
MRASRTHARPSRTGLSPAEFLAWEASQPERHEYYGGEVFAMAARVTAPWR